MFTLTPNGSTTVAFCQQGTGLLVIWWFSNWSHAPVVYVQYQDSSRALWQEVAALDLSIDPGDQLAFTGALDFNNVTRWR